MDLLLKLNGMGMTLAVVTHDPAIAARLPRIVRISDGRIIEDRTTDPPEADSVPSAEDSDRPEWPPVRPDVNPALRDGDRSLSAWFHCPEPLPDEDDLPEIRQGSPCQPEPVFTSIYDNGKEPGYVANYDSFF